MPRAMDHPSYKYAPWSAERRKAASDAAKARWQAKRAEQHAIAEARANSLISKIRRSIRLAERDMEAARVRYFDAKAKIEELQKVDGFLSECEPILAKHNIIGEFL